MGLPKFSGQHVRQRASSPKLLVLNTALMTALSRERFVEAREDPASWGRLVETAVGASLANGIAGTDIELFYWSRGDCEVDFVLRRGRRLTAIEVKSTLRTTSLPGIDAFSQEFAVTRKLLVGGQGIRLDDFLLTPATRWVE